MKQILLFLGIGVLAFGQCSRLVLNPITGQLDCVGSGTGTVTSAVIAGTANQITATGTCTITTTGTCTLSIPSAFLLPGTINKLTLTTPATGSTLTILDGKTFTASNTLTLTGTDSSSIAFGAGGTAVKIIASGTTALGTSSISSLACATVVTASATGAASTDTIIVTPNASIKAVTGYAPASAGGLSIVGYPTANTANIDVCNWGTGSITPGAVSLNWLIVRTM